MACHSHFLPGQHASNTRGACRELVESRYAADAAVCLSNSALYECGCDRQWRCMQLVTSFCRHIYLLPCHQVSSQIDMHCVAALHSEILHSHHDQGSEGSIHTHRPNALLPFIVNKLCASHDDVQKHEGCCSEWQSS